MITLVGNLKVKIMPKMIQIPEELFKMLKKHLLLYLKFTT